MVAGNPDEAGLRGSITDFNYINDNNFFTALLVMRKAIRNLKEDGNHTW